MHCEHVELCDEDSGETLCQKCGMVLRIMYSNQITDNQDLGKPDEYFSSTRKIAKPNTLLGTFEMKKNGLALTILLTKREGTLWSITLRDNHRFQR